MSEVVKNKITINQGKDNKHILARTWHEGYETQPRVRKRMALKPRLELKVKSFYRHKLLLA